MKKFSLLLLVSLLFAVGTTTAQTDNFRPKYRNISYSNQTLKFNDLASGFHAGKGAAFTSGRTYIVHPKPILGMMRFGIDATWFDINYTNAKPIVNIGDGRNNSLNQLELAMQVGVSAHINPIDDLYAHVYFRYAPTAAGILDNANKRLFGNYANYFVTGLAASWRVISIGWEYRWGFTTYNRYATWEDEIDWVGIFTGDSDSDVMDNLFREETMKAKMSGWRVYVSFRF